jgi:hypothetical protein
MESSNKPPAKPSWGDTPNIREILKTVVVITDPSPSDAEQTSFTPDTTPLSTPPKGGSGAVH